MTQDTESQAVQILSVLLIDDDKEYLESFQQTLPTELLGYQLQWQPCDNFEKATEWIRLQRYDLIVTDVYLGDIQKRDEKATIITEEIRKIRFCPILAISSGPCPEDLEIGPFIAFADKVNPQNIVLELKRLLKTGLPNVIRKLHDELDKDAGSYLWTFVKKHWDALENTGIVQGLTLERLIRRRAAVQIGRLEKASNGTPEEREQIEGLEFYIYPPISGNSFRLGDIIRHKETKEFRAILTPHCHLTIQPGNDSVRAEWVLTVKSVLAIEEIARIHNKNGKSAWSGTDKEKATKLRQRTQSPAVAMGTAGRYWFLPGFLEIPDLYCDFLQLESIPFDTLNEFDRTATLDYPFAEALQACFTNFYSAVGLPNLNQEPLKRLMNEPEVQNETPDGANPEVSERSD